MKVQPFRFAETQPLGRRRHGRARKAARRWIPQLLLLLWGWGGAGYAQVAPKPPAILTQADQVRKLTPEQAAQGYPVRVRGVVTGDVPSPDFFVQDSREGQWILTWSDEFNGPDGSPVDSSKWVFDLGGGGWGNQEQEYYTDRLKNARQEDGHLVIQAHKENIRLPDSPAWNYTSARLKTIGKFSQTYGRFEARIKLPAGQGLWPAFWMLGEDMDKAGWPDCGEIDIMENVGKEPYKVHGTIHGPGYSGSGGLEAPYELPGNRRFADAFHLFAAEWEPGVVRFYVDDALYATRRREDLHPGQKWVFDHPFFLILNVAVGGGWPGAPDDSTGFPQSMLVDYVRVYQRPVR